MLVSHLEQFGISCLVKQSGCTNDLDMSPSTSKTRPVQTQSVRPRLTRSQDVNQKETPSPLLELPVNVVALFVDKLSLYDRFCLSQTCLSLRRLVGIDWRSPLSTLRDNNPEDHLQFMSDLSRLSSNLRKCIECGQVHRWTRKHLLSTPSHKVIENSSCKDAWVNVPHELYFLQYYHIHLAV